jgi:peroxin-10
MILQEQMTRVAQQFLGKTHINTYTNSHTYLFFVFSGARRQHVWQKEINTFADVCYYGLTTLLGTQTLGEEYCDIVQINKFTQTYPGIIVRIYTLYHDQSNSPSIIASIYVGICTGSSTLPLYP